MANENTPKPTPAVKPRYKRKGPIRFEAIVPAVVITGLIALDFVLFFDGHLRRAVEWVATSLNGAEVNVADLDTSFISATFEMKDIQVTDPEKPERNRLQVGRVNFALLWDALLRAKFVVEDAGVSEIQIHTPRKSPGRVLPPDSKDSMLGRYLEDTKSEAIAAAKEKISGTVLADLARLLEGFDPAKELKNLGTLKTVGHIQKLMQDLDQKEKDWNSALASIPKEQDFLALQQRVASIPTSGGNPQEIAGRVMQVRGILDEAQTKIDAVRTKGDALTGNLGQFGTAVSDVDKVLAEDRRALESRLKLPSLDPKDMAKELFAKQVLGQVQGYNKYVVMAREYMPEKKKGAPLPEAITHARGVGHTYQFGRPNSYPLFWMRRALVSSKGEGAAFGGTVVGEFSDFTSNPPSIGKPARVQIKGEFPLQQVLGLDLQGVFDHTGEVARDSVKASVASFPVDGRTLSEAEGMKFGFASAIGSIAFNGEMVGDLLTFEAQSSFRKVAYQISAKSKILEETLQGIVKEIEAVTVGAKVAYGPKGLDLAIQSNLATELARGFQKQLQRKLAEGRAKLEQMIQAQVAEKREMLTKKYDQARSLVTSQVDARRKQADALQAQAQAKINELQSQTDRARRSAEDAVKKKGQDALKKRLPF